MILLITNKEDVTVDFVVQRLKAHGCSYYRLNTEDIPDTTSIRFSISDNRYFISDSIKGIDVDLGNVSAVYFRRPKVSSLDHIKAINNYERQYLRSELSFVLEGLYKTLRNAFWINDVYKIREAENKIYQLQIAQELGLRVPYSVISNQSECVLSAFEKCKENCITKPIKSGNMGESDNSQIIFTSDLSPSSLTASDRITAFPMYLQEKINKLYDIRCIVLGEHVYSAKIDSQQNSDSKTDWRKSSAILPHDKISLPSAIEEKVVLLTKKLGLFYSAIDFVTDIDGKYVFLECNPNGQWAWIEKRLGYPISENIAKALICGG